MAKFLKANNIELWHSIAYAQGIYDHFQYTNEQLRKRFIEKGPQGERSERRRLVKRGQKVIEIIQKIQKESYLKDKATKLINFLRKGKEGQLLHKTMLEYIGGQKIMVRGFVRGKSF
jgi:hypothetical protein